MNESRQPNPRSEQSKKLYATPQLIEYGPVEKLTQSGSGALGDGPAMAMIVCL
jgi:hypothetical protein